MRALKNQSDLSILLLTQLQTELDSTQSYCCRCRALPAELSGQLEAAGSVVSS